MKLTGKYTSSVAILRPLGAEKNVQFNTINQLLQGWASVVVHKVLKAIISLSHLVNLTYIGHQNEAEMNTSGMPEG